MSGAGLVLDDLAWRSPWLHRDVRDKAVLSLGLTAVALLLPTWPGTVVVTAVALAVLLGPAAVQPGALLRCLTPAAVFLGLGAASVAVTVSWDGGLRVGITGQSLAAAAGVLGHGLAGTTAVLILAATTPVVDVLSGLRRAGVPQVGVEIAGLVYRILFILLDSVSCIHQAQASRLGYRTRRASARSAAMLTTAVLMHAWDRARRLEDGLAGRGYVDGLRTLDPPRHRSWRFLLACLLLLVTVTAVGLLPGVNGSVPAGRAAGLVEGVGPHLATGSPTADSSAF